MSVRATPLSTIINRMNRYSPSLTVEEANKVRDLDEAIRALRRVLPCPWTLKKASLRVFDNVFEYPVATDHDELAYLDTSKNIYYPSRARFQYTSLIQFYEDPTNRNQIAEIWDNGQRYLGVNYKNIGESSQVLNEAETVGDWTVTGDASSPALDQVMYKDGNGSIRFTITSSTGTAGIRNALTVAISDSTYKKKYHFKWVYLSAVPTSLELRLETSATNYISTTGITTQFDGSPLKAGAWNLIAQDLNTATETGTFDSTSIAYERVVFTGASTGTYYIDASYLRAWELLDYWYYSIYSVKATGSTAVASKELFFDEDTGSYTTSDELVADSEWVDCVMYDSILTEMVDLKDKDMRDEIRTKKTEAWGRLIAKYPSLDPVIITNRYRFIDDFVLPPS